MSTEVYRPITCCPDLVVTLRKKMKSFEKFKRRMGLSQTTATRGRHGAVNNATPLRFHAVHGANIRLEADGLRANRVESYCKGIVFSSRPVAVDERVYVRLCSVSGQWSGAVRLGFTNVDPQTHTSQSLPKYACPDLSKKSGYWAKAVAERYVEVDCVIGFHVTTCGDVMFDVNGDVKGVLLSGVDTTRPLWMLLDVYGNVTSVEMTDGVGSVDGVNGVSEAVLQPNEQSLQRWCRPLADTAFTELNNQYGRPMLGQMSSMLSVHNVCGGGLSVDRACHQTTRHHSQHTLAVIGGSCVFGRRSLRIGEAVCVWQLSCDSASGRQMALSASSPLVLGVTACHPALIPSATVRRPDSRQLLAARPEYWAFSSVSVAAPSVVGSVDCRVWLRLCADGRLEVSVETDAASTPTTTLGSSFSTLMHCDVSVPLWPVLEVPSQCNRVQIVDVDESVSSTSTMASEAECVVCLERRVDTALYACGHVCMCHQCALRWRSLDGAVCPICRAPIRDVIRLYRS